MSSLYTDPDRRLAQVDPMNFGVECPLCVTRSGRAIDEVARARGRLVSLVAFRAKNEEWRDLQLVITFGSQ